MLVPLLLLLLCSGSLLRAQVTITSRIALDSDDLEEWIASGAVDGTSSDLEMINEGSGDQIIGLRFANLNIPAGAAIISASIQFTTDETASGATTLTFKAQAADSAATFAATSFNVSGRPTGTASVAWNVPAWNVLQEQSTSQRTPDIKALVQEVVDRSGWKAGNAIAVIISGSGKRIAESYEGAISGAAGHDISQVATLKVEYVIPTTVSVRVNAGTDDAEENIATGAIDMTSTDLELIDDGGVLQYVAMRFASMNIPKGAIIAGAHVQFATDELFSGATSLTIRGQAADNAATFTSATSNISSRPLTTASASWSPEPWTVLQEAGAKQRATGLAAIVQEITSRAGWNPGNAIVIRINGTGRRTAEAFDGSAGEAPLLVVRYYTTTPVVAPIGVFPVPRNAVWKYLDNGTDAGTAWRDSSFDDAAWAFGPAQLGYGDGDEATTVSFGPASANKYITTYFRHTFVVNDIASFDSLRVQLMRDDGAIVYLNGNEIVRSNMPEGDVIYTTRAPGTIGGADESAYNAFMVGKQHLVLGRNVLAVEVHQDAPSSSDISFSLGLEKKKNDVKVLSSGVNWKYRDDGTYPGADWYSESFDDITWKGGPSPLGYGNGNEATVLSYGTNPAAKRPAAYFRRNFFVNDTTALNSVLLRLRRDDGAIVYLNGVELLRSNMPAGPVNNTTLATAYVEGIAENEFLQFYINRSLLKIGSNSIAVEVHQNSLTSTDLAFDMEVVLQEPVTPLSPLSKGSPTDCTAGTIGCFTSVIPTAQQQSLIIPPTHTFQMLMKSGRDRYTGTARAIPEGNDFTGYIPFQGSSVDGHLSVNHENTPGGVSILDLRYNATPGLWAVDTITQVDFGPVVTTSRNCSGTVTPWGTVVTSEETYSTGDANTDGYHDVGWNVEIDPITRRIRDFNGDGKPDKLWMTGRMNHENVCVLNDSITLYQGEDGGTGCVYKFVAAQKGRLDNGTLYVLRRDNATSTTGTWVVVPNTTQTDRNTVSTVAGALGGTRWGGVEDIEVGPEGKMYFTEKGRGDTWRFRDNGMTVSDIELYLSNRNYALNTEAGTVNESWGVGNDNLAFDGEGNLWVLQDGGRNHLWMVHRDHTPANPKVYLFATTPSGGEPTGITFSPDSRFMFLSIQHPSGSNTVAQPDATNAPTVFNAAATIVIARRENLGEGTKAPVVELGGNIAACEGEVVQLRYSNPDALGIWNDNTTDSVLNIRFPGRYWITAIGNNGQITRDSVTVWFKPLPRVSLGPDRSFCEGESYTFSLDPSFSYVWEDGTTSRTRIVRRAGAYVVRATNPEGCSSSDTMVVSVLSATKPSLGNDLRICPGTSATLNAGAGFFGYQWSTGSTTPSISVAQGGTYWVRTTNANGCPSYDTVIVAVNAAATLGNDLALCEGSSATLTPGSGYTSYLWNDASTDATLRATTPGTYWVRVTDGNGCQSIDSLIIGSAPKPVVSLGLDTTICPTCSVTLDAGAGQDSYLWSTGETTRTITVNQAGNYSVTVRNASGCTAYDEVDVAVRVVAGVEEIASNDRFSLGTYPNPFTSDVTVQVDLKARSVLLVEIYDLNGRRLAVLNDAVTATGRHEFRIKGDDLGGSGVYMLKVSADGRELSRKLVRQ